MLDIQTIFAVPPPGGVEELPMPPTSRRLAALVTMCVLILAYPIPTPRAADGLAGAWLMESYTWGGNA